MSLCHILPPHREHRFRGAAGCSKEISHDGKWAEYNPGDPHMAKDGSVVV
jgi:hypothetical protein